jgi:hypothetical protein
MLAITFSRSVLYKTSISMKEVLTKGAVLGKRPNRFWNSLLTTKQSAVRERKQVHFAISLSAFPTPDRVQAMGNVVDTVVIDMETEETMEMIAGVEAAAAVVVGEIITATTAAVAAEAAEAEAAAMETEVSMPIWVDEIHTQMAEAAVGAEEVVGILIAAKGDRPALEEERTTPVVLHASTMSLRAQHQERKTRPRARQARSRSTSKTMEQRPLRPYRRHRPLSTY